MTPRAQTILVFALVAILAATVAGLLWTVHALASRPALSFPLIQKSNP